MWEVIYLPRFKRECRKLNQEIKHLLIEKGQIFKTNPFDPRLKTHHLKGRLNGLCAFSLNHRYRIIFQILNNKSILFHTIGKHDIYNTF